MPRHFGVLMPSTKTTVEIEYRLLPASYQAHVGRLMSSTPGRTFSPSRDEDIDYQSRLLGTAKVELVILAQTSASLFADDYDEVDLNAPPFGDLDVGDRFQKHNYPFGIVVNARGERFLDEGLDFHSYTYAKYGGELLNQPGMFAWQIFDQKVVHLLREEYRIPRITKERADSFEALAGRLEGVDGRRFLETMRAFNAAPRPEVPFNPNIRDGLATRGLPIDKTNWAQRLDTPPYEAYAVTTGITFTFGGLKITNDAQVEDTAGHPIPGLFAAGEIVGGLYYHNYDSGTGLMAGAVFGRIAGRSAAAGTRAR